MQLTADIFYLILVKHPIDTEKLSRLYVATDICNLLKFMLMVKSIFNLHPPICTYKYYDKINNYTASLSQLLSHQIYPPGSPHDCKVYGLLISPGFFPLMHHNHFPFIEFWSILRSMGVREVSEEQQQKMFQDFPFITWTLACKELYGHYQSLLITCWKMKYS